MAIKLAWNIPQKFWPIFSFSHLFFHSNADALYKWLTKDSYVSGGSQVYSDYNPGYSFNEPAFVSNIDSGSTFVPAATATTNEWKKKK